MYTMYYVLLNANSNKYLVNKLMFMLNYTNMKYKINVSSGDVYNNGLIFCYVHGMVLFVSS